MTSLLRRRWQAGESRYTIDDWTADKFFAFNGATYPIFGGSYSTSVEDVENSFPGYIQGAYKSDGIVFACMLARMMIFSEARFQWQQMRRGRPGDLFGTPELALLERPWPNGTTGELLSRMEQDTSLAGNFYAVREGDRLRRLRPDWVTILLTAPPDQAVASDVVGYEYKPGGTLSRVESGFYQPEQICHWSPIPDPDAQYRGMSWLTPVVREVLADKAATMHKLKFFENGATLNTIVSLKETVTEEQFKKFVQAMTDAHKGVDNAYKTLYVGGGADVTLVGADMKQLDFKSTQGAGESRVAAAAGIHPVIVGLSEGLAGSSLNQGNFNAARRLTADKTMRPLWRSATAALESVVRVPDGARLWFDDRDIAFLRDDRKDLAGIQGVESQSIRTLLDAGYTADSVKVAVIAQDWSLLEHSGLFSVQLQPAGGAEGDADAKAPAETEDDDISPAEGDE